MLNFLLRSNERLADSGGATLDQVRIDSPITGSNEGRSRLVHDQTLQATSTSTAEAVEHPITRQTTVDIAVPIYNESRDLEPSVHRLREFLNDQFPFPAMITIVDNASTGSPGRSQASEPSILAPRAVVAHSVLPGQPVMPTSLPTWTLTCRPASNVYCHSSHPLYQDTATWRSAAG
jgi:hypothetical protein